MKARQKINKLVPCSKCGQRVRLGRLIGSLCPDCWDEELVISVDGEVVVDDLKLAW